VPNVPLQKHYSWIPQDFLEFCCSFQSKFCFPFLFLLHCQNRPFVWRMILDGISLGKTKIDACGDKLFGGRSGKTSSVFRPRSCFIWPATFRSDDPEPRSRHHFFEPSHQVDLFVNPILSNNQHRELCFTDSLERSLVSRFPAQRTSCFPAKPLHAWPVIWPSFRGGRPFYLQCFVSPTLLARSDCSTANLRFTMINFGRVVQSRFLPNL